MLHNVLTPEECDQYIAITEQMGYGEAPVTTFGGMMLMPDVRNNKRVMWQTSDDVWKPIWERVKPLCPKEYQLRGRVWTPIGMNERFRFYRCTCNASYHEKLTLRH